MKRALIVLVALAAALLLAGWFGYGRPVTAGALGFTAKHLCSLHFVSGLPIERAKALYVDPVVQPLAPWIAVEVGDAPARVVAHALGQRARADHRPGLGCTVRHGDAPLAGSRTLPVDPGDTVDLDARANRFDEAALERALDAAFENPEGRRNTLAVAVLHRGDLVGERYAPGIDAATPLPGWSMTKSVTALLVGLAAAEGRLDPAAPGAIPGLDEDDPRGAISIDHLLRMTSGLALTEDRSGADRNTQMLFGEPDAAAYAARQPLAEPVGAHWAYMGGSSLLAAHAVHRSVAGRSDGEAARTATYAWIDERLFAPLGVTSARIEPDEAGTFVGPSFMLATARDWARLGIPLTHAGAKRLPLPDGWQAHLLRHTPASGDRGYGAGFWLNAVPTGLRYPSLPAETVWMNGLQGQYVMIVPSADLVVARLGASATRDRGIEALVRGALDALSTPDATGAAQSDQSPPL